MGPQDLRSRRFTPFPHMGSLLLIKLVALRVLKSRYHAAGTECVEIVDASMSVPTLCNVALALWLLVGGPLFGLCC